MRVIAEFVDGRNGKRYAPGDGDKIDPALTDEQVQRLTRAGCLKQGSEGRTASDAAGPAADPQEQGGDDPLDLTKKTRGDLEALAATRNVDISGCTNKQQIIDKLSGI